MCIISIQVYAAVFLPLGFLCLQFSLKRSPVALKSSMNSGFNPKVSQSAQCVSVFVCHCGLGNIIDFTPCFRQVSDPHACTVCMFALCKIHWSSSAILLSINTVLVELNHKKTCLLIDIQQKSKQKKINTTEMLSQLEHLTSL